MMRDTCCYVEGRKHVLPILNLCVPGIDPNDAKKTMATFQIISTIVNLMPIVDCSLAASSRSDLTEVSHPSSHVTSFCLVSVSFLFSFVFFRLNESCVWRLHSLKISCASSSTGESHLLTLSVAK